MEARLRASGAELAPATDSLPERPILTYEADPAATAFSTVSKTYNHNFDAVARVYMDRHKEPLPDPSQPELERITVEFERYFEKWNCVVQKRIYKLKNVAPYVIRRFAQQEHVYFVEEEVLDRKNKILYVRGQNRSFANYGTLRTFSTFQVDHDHPEKTILSQGGEARLSNALGMARGTIERFLRTSFESGSEKSRELLEARLADISTSSQS